ncbi:MAG: sulfurtransferase TusA family protein [Candidatus Puniceispirillales bacterium]|jgi:tRNA 2-thiouridine synthesizing protein A|nr:sulfurtransferase TusA family protein [Alphaproteobacteria bacterium]|tara:strand:- start:167 stop:406 length:240 start_codon:yes stop_codon:yes gene_type:complete
MEILLILKHDFTGLKCPLPVLKAKRVLKQLKKGEKVVFISDDPASPIDFSHFSENEGYDLSITTSEFGKHFFTLSKPLL